jgi:hypothetical protein
LVSSQLFLWWCTWFIFGDWCYAYFLNVLLLCYHISWALSCKSSSDRQMS